MYRYAPHCISCGYPLAYGEPRNGFAAFLAFILGILLALGLCSFAWAIHTISPEAAAILGGIAFLVCLLGIRLSLRLDPPKD